MTLGIGIPFLVDFGADCDCITRNVRELFKDLVAVSTVVKTASGSGSDTRTRYQGTFMLQLPDDDGIIHCYDIPICVYDPYTTYNLLGGSKLNKFFGDKSTSNDP